MYRSNTVIAQNPMTLIIANLEADMLNTGWVSVNTANIQNAGSANTSARWDWWMSPAANNSIGNNWYLGIATDMASNCQLFMTIAANANVNWGSGNQIAGFTPIIGSLPIAANGFSTATANTCNNSGNVFTIGTAIMPNTGTGTLFMYTVTIDRIIVCVANAACTVYGSTFYVGMYDSFMPLSIDPYPLIQSNIASYVAGATASMITAGSAGAINEPANNTTYVGNFCVSTYFNWTALLQGDGYMGAVAQQNGNPRFPISRTVVLGRGNAANSCGMRGLLKDVVISGFTGFTQAPYKGDMMTYNFNGTNTTYTYMGDEIGSHTYGSPLSSSAGTSTWVAQV
jgi:hypothetical protein